MGFLFFASRVLFLGPRIFYFIYLFYFIIFFHLLVFGFVSALWELSHRKPKRTNDTPQVAACGHWHLVALPQQNQSSGVFVLQKMHALVLVLEQPQVKNRTEQPVSGCPLTKFSSSCCFFFFFFLLFSLSLSPGHPELVAPLPPRAGPAQHRHGQRHPRGRGRPGLLRRHLGHAARARSRVARCSAPRRPRHGVNR